MPDFSHQRFFEKTSLKVGWRNHGPHHGVGICVRWKGGARCSVDPPMRPKILGKVFCCWQKPFISGILNSSHMSESCHHEWHFILMDLYKISWNWIEDQFSSYHWVLYRILQKEPWTTRVNSPLLKMHLLGPLTAWGETMEELPLPITVWGMKIAAPPPVTELILQHS